MNVIISFSLQQCKTCMTAKLVGAEDVNNCNKQKIIKRIDSNKKNLKNQSLWWQLNKNCNKNYKNEAKI